MNHVEYQLAVRDFQGYGGVPRSKPTPIPPFEGRCYCSLTWGEKSARLKWTVVNENIYGKGIRTFAQCNCK
jgi:hypothetical protein